MDKKEKQDLKARFEEMAIKCWTKTIYTDSPDINSILRNRDLPPGKRILRVDGEMHEIDVNAPNVEESEFCPFNVCPVGSIAVEEACLENAETMKPIDKEVIETLEYMRKDDKGRPVPVDRMVAGEAVDFLGRPVWEKKKIKTIKASCPDGWIMGERTDQINWLGGKKPLLTAGIVADAGDENLEGREPISSEGAELEVDTTLMCVKKQPMPMEKKWVEMITDSIIGWGGYAEFPFWDVPWGVMNDIAEHRSRWTGSYMTHAAEIEEGYRACWNDYNVYPCACFKDREDAKLFEDARKYYDYSNQYQKDILEQFKEEGVTQPTEEQINERMQSDREFFFEDIGSQFPSYLGIGERTFRDSPVQYTSKWDGKARKSRELIVLVKEDL